MQNLIKNLINIIRIITEVDTMVNDSFRISDMVIFWHHLRYRYRAMFTVCYKKKKQEDFLEK
jgi:hypothetical protein